MGLDNIIDRFQGRLCTWSYRYLGLSGLYPTPEELVHGNFFADKYNVIASFVSSSYYEFFRQDFFTPFS